MTIGDCIINSSVQIDTWVIQILHRNCCKDLLSLNSMRTTTRLVKMNILSHSDPIRESVRKNSLRSKFVIHNCQSLILIGLTNEHFVVLTNQKLCYKAGSAQGLIINKSHPLLGTLSLHHVWYTTNLRFSSRPIYCQFTPIDNL